LLGGEAGGETEKQLDRLAAEGHPVMVLKLEDKSDVGGEFFRWEMATAIACALLKVNAFDQPDVQAAKDKAKALLRKVLEGEKLKAPSGLESLRAAFGSLREGDYIALLAFVPDQPEIRRKLIALRRELHGFTKRAVTLGFGPRYLHSTGQLHKGGPDSGVFIVVTQAATENLPIPGEKFGFGDLLLAQAMGDLEALRARKRRVTHLELPDLSAKSLDDFCAEAKQAAQL